MQKLKRIRKRAGGNWQAPRQRREKLSVGGDAVKLWGEEGKKENGPAEAQASRNHMKKKTVGECFSSPCPAPPPLGVARPVCLGPTSALPPLRAGGAATFEVKQSAGGLFPALSSVPWSSYRALHRAATTAGP